MWARDVILGCLLADELEPGCRAPDYGEVCRCLLHRDRVDGVY